MFELIYLVLAILGTAWAGYIDLKTTDIPDWITVGMIISGLGLHAIESVATVSAEPFFASLLVTIVLGFFGILMYFSGMWGGGDALLLTGVGALLPTYSGYSSWLPFPLTYLINVLIIGIFYSLAYIIIIGLKNKKMKKQLINKSHDPFISVPTIIAIFFIGYSLVTNLHPILTLVIGFLLLLPIIHLLTITAEKNFYKKINTRYLRPDDMIGEDIPKLGISKLHIRGLTKREVTKIRKIKKSVLIREGIRYGLVFLLALLFTLRFGLPSL